MAQDEIKKDMSAFRKGGVFKPLKKSDKLNVLGKAVVTKPIRKACPTLNKKGLILVNGPGGRFTLTWWKCYLDSCASYHSFFVGRVPT